MWWLRPSPLTFCTLLYIIGSFTIFLLTCVAFQVCYGRFISIHGWCESQHNLLCPLLSPTPPCVSQWWACVMCCFNLASTPLSLVTVVTGEPQSGHLPLLCFLLSPTAPSCRTHTAGGGLHNTTWLYCTVLLYLTVKYSAVVPVQYRVEAPVSKQTNTACLLPPLVQPSWPIGGRRGWCRGGCRGHFGGNFWGDCRDNCMCYCRL